MLYPKKLIQKIMQRRWKNQSKFKELSAMDYDNLDSTELTADTVHISSGGLPNSFDKYISLDRHETILFTYLFNFRSSDRMN